MTWQPVEHGLPPSGQWVLAVVQSPRPVVALAQWAAKGTLPLHPDCDGDYDEVKDEYFATEGWYQVYQDGGGDISDEPFWKIHEPVSHWMPLPEVPA